MSEISFWTNLGDGADQAPHGDPQPICSTGGNGMQAYRARLLR